MAISNIEPGRNLHNPNSTHKFTRISSSSASGGAKKSDTVNISVEAKELSQKERVDNHIKKEPLPYQAFALPKWFAKYLPKEAIVSHPDVDIRASYTYSSEKKRAISYCSNTSLSAPFCNSLFLPE